MLRHRGAQASGITDHNKVGEGTLSAGTTQHAQRQTRQDADLDALKGLEVLLLLLHHRVDVLLQLGRVLAREHLADGKRCTKNRSQNTEAKAMHEASAKAVAAIG